MTTKLQKTYIQGGGADLTLQGGRQGSNNMMKNILSK